MRIFALTFAVSALMFGAPVVYAQETGLPPQPEMPVASTEVPGAAPAEMMPMPEPQQAEVPVAPVDPNAAIAASVPEAVPTPMPQEMGSAVPNVQPVDPAATAAVDPNMAAVDPAAVQPDPSAVAMTQQPASMPGAPAVDEAVKAMAYAYKYYTEGNLAQAATKLVEAQTYVAQKSSGAAAPVPASVPESVPAVSP